MTLNRKIRKGDKLTIQAIAVEDQHYNVIKVKIGQYQNLATEANPVRSIFTDTIVSVETKAIEVGDRVKSSYGNIGVVKAIAGDYLWVLADNADSPLTYDQRQQKFEVI